MLVKYLRNDKGMVLPLVFMVFVVLIILGTALIHVSGADQRHSIYQSQKMQAHYLARSGAEAVASAIIEDPQLAVTLAAEGISKRTPFEGVGEFEVEVSLGGDDVILESTGYAGKVSETVTLILTKESSGGATLPMGMAVVVLGEGSEADPVFMMEGSAKITGSVEVNSIAQNSVQFAWSPEIIDGDLFTGPGGNPDEIIKTDRMDDNSNAPSPDPNLDPWARIQAPWLNVPNGAYNRSLSSIITCSMPSFPEFPDLPLHSDLLIEKNQYETHKVIDNGSLYINNYIVADYTLQLLDNYYFPEIIMTGGRTLNIDLRNGDRSIVVDHLNIDNGYINIIGTEKLTIYVRDAITFNNGKINDINQINQLEIYLKGSNDPFNPKNVNISGSQKVYALLYAEDANIDLTGGGGFQGHIITGGGRVIISGGSRATANVIYAPNAAVSIEGGAYVKGIVVSEKFSMSGGTTLEYNDLSTDSSLEGLFGSGTSYKYKLWK